MEKENFTYKLVAIYKGEDGYGYGTIQTKTVKKEFDSISDLRDWIFNNDSIEEFSGFHVETVLYLSSYKIYETKCIECYKDEN